MKHERTIQIGPGFCGLLALLFIGLKLTGHIDWSWVWILCPLWAPFALVFGFLAVACLIGISAAGFLVLLEHLQKKKGP